MKDLVNVLMWIKDEGGMPYRSAKMPHKTMMKLQEMKLISLNRYASGSFWEITDEGIKEINQNKLYNPKFNTPQP